MDTAASKVTSYLDSVIASSDIYYKLTQNGNTPVSGLGEKFYPRGRPEFELKKRVPIPEELNMEIRNMRTQFSMGLFPEISRTWIVVDNNIYMWNYDTNDDLAYFDCIPNTILKVALVKVKRDVFSMQVSYGLVVCTIAEILLYPMLFDIAQDGSTSMQIDPATFFKVDLDGQTISDVVSTNSGRIFYTADDKLFEFVYERHHGWFRDETKCRTVDQSSSLLSALLPKPLSFFGNSVEELEQISLDKSRNILYCLGKNGSIKVFDLGADGTQCKNVIDMSAGQIANQANLLTQYNYSDDSYTSIVSICALEAEQSNQLNLVAVTTKGVRLYFSVLVRALIQQQSADGQGIVMVPKHFGQSEMRPRCLRVAHVRFSPGVAPHSVYKDGNLGVSIAFVDNSTTVMATANRELVWAMSDLYYPHAKHHTESMTDLKVGGNVWAISPTVKKAISSPKVEPGNVSRVAPHPFLMQHVDKHRSLVLCSSEAVYEFEQVNPEESLREALMSGGTEGASTVELTKTLGTTEVLVLAAGILISEAPIDERIKDKAASLFFKYKDQPELVDADRVMSGAQQLDQWSPGDSIAEWRGRMRTPLHSSTPMPAMDQSAVFGSPFSPMVNASRIGGSDAMLRHAPSRRHDALYYFFSRLVAPIWHYPLCEIDGSKIKTIYKADEMAWLSGELRKYVQVLERYRLVPTTESQLASGDRGRLSDEACSIEFHSLQSLKKLVEISAETLSLWSVADDCDLGAIAAATDSSSVSVLAGKRFSQLVAEHSNLNAELIRLMIKYFLGDDAGTKDLSDKLRRLCPNLYSSEDACVTNAMEILREAGKVPAGPVRKKLVIRAVEQLKLSIVKVSLVTVCQTLSQLSAYEEAAELCLLKAKRDDPRQLAVIAYKHGRTNDDRDVVMAERMRAECYKVIGEILDKLEADASSVPALNSVKTAHRDTVMSVVLNSEDELAHASLFRWMLERNKANMIIQSKSPYVEQFLSNEISCGRGQRYLDLLWRFYEKSGNYDKAASLLSRLADHESRDISLSQRVEYLAHAVFCAQSSTNNATKKQIVELRDNIEVAQIQLTIKRHIEGPTARQTEAVRLLNGQIMPLQELLVKFAIPFELHTVQLSILSCGKVYSEERIVRVWEAILKDAIRDGHNATDRLLSVIGELYAIYGDTAYFPRETIIRRLLQIGSGSRFSPVFFLSLATKIGLSLALFLRILINEYRSGDPWWSTEESGQVYMVLVGITMVEAFVDEPQVYGHDMRAETVSACDECVAAFLLDARDVSATSQMRSLGQRLVELQQRLAEM